MKTNHKTFLIKMFPQNSIGAEIGVWTGKFTRQVLSITKPKRYCLIDPWKFMPKYPKRWYGGSSAKSQLDMDKIFNEIKKEFEPMPHIKLYRMMADEASKEFYGNYFDWVYIDGDHSYEEVRRDILNYYKLIRPSGMLCGDDWHLKSVQRAVNSLLKKGHKIHSHTYQWWIIKPDTPVELEV